MSSPPSNPLPRFLLGLIIIMPLSMALWWFGLRDYLLWALEQLVEPVLQWFMAETVIGVVAQDQVWLLKTSLSPIDNPINLLALPISTNRFTICFPLLWGLLLATPRGAWLKQFIGGTLVLIPAALLIAVLLIQFKLALQINHQAILTEVPSGSYVLAWPYAEHWYYLMAVGRQLALLVLPTLAPLTVWVLFNRRFIRSLIFEGLLARSVANTDLAIEESENKS